MGPNFQNMWNRFDTPGKYLPLIILAAQVLGSAFPVLVEAQITEGNSRLALPDSHLNQPFEVPVFVVGHAAMGGGFQKQDADVGYGGALIFRPGHSVNILDGFFGLTTSMILQVDYLEVPDGGDIISGDLIMRRYFNNRGDQATAKNFFLGLGTGVSDIRRPDPDDDAAGEHWSILVEGGHEWQFKSTLLVFFKGQYRWMINAGRTWSAWSVMGGLGLPWP